MHRFDGVSRRTGFIAVVLCVSILGGCCCLEPRPPEKKTAETCDYTQVDEPLDRRKFATIESSELSPECVMLRNERMTLLRAPKYAEAYETSCSLEVETVAYGSEGSDCKPTRVFAEEDRFHIRDWDGKKVLSIRHADGKRREIELQPGSAQGVDGVPWLMGTAYNLHFFVYLENSVKGQVLNKVYRIEVFDTQSANSQNCARHMPTYGTNAAQVSCGLPPQTEPGEQQSDTASGGEPPRQR